MYYETCGSGFPIILIHGFSPDHRVMKGCMEPLFARRPGWQWIYPDLPGMGQTPGSEQIKSTDDRLDVVIDFIDAVIPEQPFLIAGVSYGGYLSLAVLGHKFDQVAVMALISLVIFGDRSQRDLPPRTALVELAHSLAELAPDDTEQYGSMAVVQDEQHRQRFRHEILSEIRIAECYLCGSGSCGSSCPHRTKPPLSGFGRGMARSGARVHEEAGKKGTTMSEFASTDYALTYLQKTDRIPQVTGD